MRLHPQAVAAGVRLSAHDRLDSTNAQALARARNGETGPLWITAQEQRQGRGRHGRVWVSAQGNLFASLLLSNPAPQPRMAELCFVAALAVHDAILSLAPQLGCCLKIKWPNDILAYGFKIAGILIESETTARGAAVVIGVGVNCRSHPTGTSYPAGDLATLGAEVSREALFEALSLHLMTRLRQWDRGAGFHGIRSDWLERACGLGEQITVRLPERELTGRFASLDDSGRLLLDRADGLTSIAAGEVFPSHSDGSPAPLAAAADS